MRIVDNEVYGLSVIMSVVLSVIIKYPDMLRIIESKITSK